MVYDLEKPLFAFAKCEGSAWKIRHAVEGVQILGGIGSGKTSGSGRMLALNYLKAGFGGLVLTVKPDEIELWKSYCETAGRADDLLIVEPNGEHTFNILDFESGFDTGEKKLTANIVQVLQTVIRASEEKGGGKADDPFWEKALDMLIFNVIDLCNLAYGRLKVEQLYAIVQSCPKADAPLKESSVFHKTFSLARGKVSVPVENWREKQSESILNALSDDQYEAAICDAVPEAQLLKSLDHFFFESYGELSDKTRSIIDFSFVGFLFQLLHDPVFSLFFKNPSTFTPEVSRAGKIILLNLPIKTYHKVGRDIQIMFKYIWQRAMEKNIPTDETRPVFVWADEAQHFIHEHDADFQATARSSRIATVYISQNLPNYYANMGGAKADHKVKSFLGTLGTKIFHANADVETNKYASELIGEAMFEKESDTASMSGQFSASTSISSQLEKIVRQERFVSLKNGGKANDGKVEGYVHVQGTPICNGDNHTLVTFNQNYKPLST